MWAEPCLLPTATSKLSGAVEQWLSAAERLYGPYLWGRYVLGLWEPGGCGVGGQKAPRREALGSRVWGPRLTWGGRGARRGAGPLRVPACAAPGRYDIVFLPPSFPIVAMENPCLTFIISSILESDEFLVIDVIHEVAHSWFGNAVTNATWEEMWLSEGLATYAQRRITTETYGTAHGRPLGGGGPGGAARAGAAQDAEPSLAPGVWAPGRACVQPGSRGSAPQGSGPEQRPRVLRPAPCPCPGAAFTCLETAFRLDALHRQMKLLGEDSPVSKLQVKLEPGTRSRRACSARISVTPQGRFTTPCFLCPVASPLARCPSPRRPPQAPSACHRLTGSEHPSQGGKAPSVPSRGMQTRGTAPLAPPAPGHRRRALPRAGLFCL